MMKQLGWKHDVFDEFPTFRSWVGGRCLGKTGVPGNQELLFHDLVVSCASCRGPKKRSCEVKIDKVHSTVRGVNVQEP